MQKKTLFISRLSLLIALTLIIQLAGFPQPVTGPLVNAMLLITTAMLGIVSGIILGCMTPLVAVLRGELPPVLAPMIPFIIAGNILLAAAFGLIKNNASFSAQRLLNPVRRIGLYLAIVVAAIVKYLFLSFSVRLILPLILAHDISDTFIFMMTTPQLVTALIGGALALMIYEILYRAELIR
ncbi:ECF transporter S component [candidate division KSB1 bacterium]|nr:ECF transporter S component [candidate division KSB1 bacterium]